MICLDTNVLIYSVDPGSAEKRARSLDVIRRTAGAGMLAEQALFEFIHISTRKLGMPHEQAVATVRSFAMNFNVALPPENIVDAAIQLMLSHKIAIWDARLLAVCAAAGGDTLLSEDLQDGGRYGVVTVVNPFEAINTAIIDRLLPI